MNWNRLFEMQSKLDTYIIETHNLSDRDLLEERILALLVELGELANETRCFKFWSTKQANKRNAILEEYVDNIHFLLSLGLTKGYRYDQELRVEKELSLTKQFTSTFEVCIAFKNEQTEKSYHRMFSEILELGGSLSFTEEEVQQAYYDKNEENFKRQNEGY